MGQKINPIGFRLQVNRTWDSRWYAEGDKYGNLLLEDLKIREFVKKGLQKDAEARYTASEMVEHEFVKARSPETDARAFQAFLKFVFEKN